MAPSIALENAEILIYNLGQIFDSNVQQGGTVFRLLPPVEDFRRGQLCRDASLRDGGHLQTEKTLALVQ